MKITNIALLLKIEGHAMKTEHHQIWVNFQVEHVVSYLLCQQLPEMIKMVTMALLFKIETCNKTQPLLYLGQSSTWTWNAKWLSDLSCTKWLICVKHEMTYMWKCEMIYLCEMWNDFEYHKYFCLYINASFATWMY